MNTLTKLTQLECQVFWARLASFGHLVLTSTDINVIELLFQGMNALYTWFYMYEQLTERRVCYVLIAIIPATNRAIAS